MSKNQADLPPIEDDFDFRSDARLSGEFQNSLFKPGVHYSVCRPVSTIGTPLIFKALPVVARDGRSLYPMRLSAENRHFSPWLVVLRIAKYVGDKAGRRKDLVLYDPRLCRTQGYDPSTNPYKVLFDRIRKAVDAPPGSPPKMGRSEVNTTGWKALISYPHSVLSRDQDVGFVRGAVFLGHKTDKKPGEQKRTTVCAKYSPPLGLSEDDSGVLVEIPSAALGSLVKLCSAPNPNKDSVSSENDFSIFAHPDITDVENGEFLVIYRKDLQPDGSEPLDIQKLLMSRAGDSAMSGFDDDDTGLDYRPAKGQDGKADGGGIPPYLCNIVPKVSYLNKGKTIALSPDLSDHVNDIRSRYLPWSEIFSFPTHEELCTDIASLLKDYTVLLKYGWYETPEFLNYSDVKAVINNRVQRPGVDIPSEEDPTSTNPQDVFSDEADEMDSAALGDTSEMDKFFNDSLSNAHKQAKGSKKSKTEDSAKAAEEPEPAVEPEQAPRKVKFKIKRSAK